MYYNSKRTESKYRKEHDIALVIDLYLGASASATAVNNLMQCSVGAGGVAVIQLIID